MSRSLNNAVTIAQLKQKGFTGRDIRYFLLGMNYRKPINYSDEALQMAKNTLRKIDTFIDRLQSINQTSKSLADVDQMIYDLHRGFEKTFDDDLNVSGALSAFFDFIGKVNKPLAHGQVGATDAGKIIGALKGINEILGVMDFDKQSLKEEIKELIDRRETARKTGRWGDADSIRDQLAGLGIEILDTQQGTLCRIK
jgi:cysteinyl-tRNA synthetase